MTRDVEILVHVTAPSTSKDDANYRALAAACLDFMPSRSIDLAEPRVPGPAIEPHTDLLSPQASFRSAWGNINQPGGWSNSQHSQTSAPQDEEGTSQDTWVQPPSEVADSMPDNDISMDGFTTPTRVMSYYLQTIAPSSEASQELEGNDLTTVYEGEGDISTLLGRGSAAPQGRAASAVEAPANQAESWPQEATIRMPDQGATPDHQAGETHVTQTPPSSQRSGSVRSPRDLSPCTTGKRRRSAVRSSWDSASEILDTIIPSTLPPRADSEPPQPKRHKATCLARSSSDVLPRGSKQPRSPQHEFADEGTAPPGLEIDWTSTIHIVSREPPASNIYAGPEPSRHLEECSRDCKKKKRYKVKFQARDIQLYERGYWLLGIDAWAPWAKIKTWGFLGNYICRDNKAGWGTRACRDDDWNWIRLYGWEHLAGELYMLLYVASYRRLKYAEITWYDGAGEALITAGARADKGVLDENLSRQMGFL